MLMLIFCLMSVTNLAFDVLILVLKYTGVDYNLIFPVLQALSVVLKDGKIVMTAAPGDVREVITSKKDVYNDGRWHYVTITKQGREWVEIM